MFQNLGIQIVLRLLKIFKEKSDFGAQESSQLNSTEVRTQPPDHFN